MYSCTKHYIAERIDKRMELYEYSAHELAKMYRNKEITVPQVIESIYKRIDEKDNQKVEGS